MKLAVIYSFILFIIASAMIHFTSTYNLPGSYGDNNRQQPARPYYRRFEDYREGSSPVVLEKAEQGDVTTKQPDADLLSDFGYSVSRLGNSFITEDSTTSNPKSRSKDQNTENENIEIGDLYNEAEDDEKEPNGPRKSRSLQKTDFVTDILTQTSPFRTKFMFINLFDELYGESFNASEKEAFINKIKENIASYKTNGTITDRRGLNQSIPTKITDCNAVMSDAYVMGVISRYFQYFIAIYNEETNNAFPNSTFGLLNIDTLYKRSLLTESKKTKDVKCLKKTKLDDLLQAAYEKNNKNRVTVNRIPLNFTSDTVPFDFSRDVINPDKLEFAGAGNFSGRPIEYRMSTISLSNLNAWKIAVRKRSKQISEESNTVMKGIEEMLSEIFEYLVDLL